MFSTAPPRSDLNTEDKSTQMLLGVHCSENNINSHKRGNALSAESDVVLVVAKAKRAAQSLWMILHAQSCQITICPHVGCETTKSLLLHVKECSAGTGDFQCPDNYHGCYPARKLLNHYRRCREIRIRQIRSRIGRKQSHSCLVCSLTARYAKTVLENRNLSVSSTQCNDAPSPKPVHVSSVYYANNFTLNQAESKYHAIVTTNKVPHRKSVRFENITSSPSLTRSSSRLSMPPPPPRTATSPALNDNVH